MKLCDLCSRDEETNEFKEEDERMGEQEEKIETGAVCGASPSFMEVIEYENSLIDLRVESLYEFSQMIDSKHIGT